MPPKSTPPMLVPTGRSTSFHDPWTPLDLPEKKKKKDPKADWVLPEKSWPIEGHNNKFERWDLSPWPMDEDGAYDEPASLRPTNPPDGWQKLKNSKDVYPGPNFPRPKGGFTGNHDRDYFQSIKEHAGPIDGRSGQFLIGYGSWGDRNWRRRCYEINKEAHEFWVFARKRAHIKLKPEFENEGSAGLSENSGTAAPSEINDSAGPSMLLEKLTIREPGQEGGKQTPSDRDPRASGGRGGKHSSRSRSRGPQASGGNPTHGNGR